MRRLYAFLAVVGLFSGALGCHHHVAGVCDCDCCNYGCCGYGLCGPSGGCGCGCGAPAPATIGTVPPPPIMHSGPVTPIPEVLQTPPTKEITKGTPN